MQIEKDIFKRSIINFDKLVDYGFKKEKDSYIYTCNFLNNDFQAIILIDKKGNISSKIIDLKINEEYTNINSEMNGEFVNKVRNAYKDILFNIKNNCFETNYFISSQTNRITKYIKDKYNNGPEFLWDKYDGYGVFRNSSNNKWYAIIMNIDFSKISESAGEIEIINVKLDRNKILELLKKKGFYEAYHMSKKDWISVVLNDTLKDEEIFLLIDQSHKLVS